MSEYLLEPDNLIGHKLIVKRKGMFKLKLVLKNISYNQVINSILCNMEEVSPENLYEDIRFCLNQRKGDNVITHLYSKDPLNKIGNSSLEKRINDLQFLFIDSFLNKALKILEENNKI